MKANDFSLKKLGLPIMLAVIMMAFTAQPLFTQVTLLDDSFEGSPFDGNWDDIASDWRQSSQYVSGSHSAYANSNDYV